VEQRERLEVEGHGSFPEGCYRGKRSADAARAHALGKPRGFLELLRQRARSTARASRLLVLIASSEQQFVKMARAAINDSTANPWVA
jgi:hypothetical protein